MVGLETALLGAALGLGVSALTSGGNQNYGYSMPNTINYQNQIATIPTAPEAPVSPADDNAAKSAAMLEAEEEEKKRRAAEAEANKTNFTGGLGVSTPATVQRKTLLG